MVGNGNSSNQLAGIINTIPKFVGSNPSGNYGSNSIVNSLFSTRMNEFYSSCQFERYASEIIWDGTGLKFLKP